MNGAKWWRPASGAATVASVGWMAYTASLVHSLAWPAGVVAVIVILRRPISDALGHGLRRLKIGLFEAEWDRQREDVRKEVRGSPELASAPIGPAANLVQEFDSALALGAAKLRDDLGRLAEASPAASVTTAYGQIEARLVEMLDEAGAPSYTAVGGPALARLAQRHGLISDQTMSAIEGLAVMRNLAAHGPGGEIDRQRAREYLALADAVLYTLRSKPAGRGPQPQA